ncbi:MAG TPA: diacylglycerol kinase family protein [Bacteroidota bacterium]|nr:diacylglycerol kinase family protein [Bacteroidota bacterium]
MSKSYAFIVNPAAGRGKGKGMAARLEDMMHRYPLVKRTVEETQDTGAMEPARRLAKTHDVIVAVGGDGTVHEVANGIAKTSAALAVLPVGSGNDFARLFGLAPNIERALHGVMSGMTIRIDLGRIRVQNTDGLKDHSCYFINTAGIGLDAAIAAASARMKRFKGLLLYLVSTVRTLSRFRAQQYEIRLGNHRQSGKYLLVCFGNGDREGGGFQLTPDARPDDGAFQVCVVKEMSASAALRAVPLALQGNHGRHPSVSLVTATAGLIESEEAMIVHADGEIISSGARKVAVGIVPGGLRVIVPA